MPQKTNLNVSPYYDDFDKDNNFYKVLFKPGYPIQARELTGLQSILQNQIESFGSHIFKEGSMVIPGGITCDNAFTTIKVNSDHLGIDVSVYLQDLTNSNNGRGIRVRGQTTGVVGILKGYLLPPQEGVEDITVFVKYREGSTDNEVTQFADSEILILEENFTYGNTTLNSGDTILTLKSSNSNAIGYAVGVSKGVYFIRGTFVDVPNAQIILDPYNNNPSYRVGFDILEEIITSDDDNSLNDNAKGFTNYSAPGADRLKISVKLSKKELTDTTDINFVELVKVVNGRITKLQNTSEYSIIKEYFAKRTFQESGNYSIDRFNITAANSLNDEIGNGGLYVEGQRTENGNVPTDDTMCIRVSSGTAYVKGFDIDLVGGAIVDVPKPRSTRTIESSLVPFNSGSLLKVNNVYGVPYINIGAPVSGGGGTNDNIVELYNRRRDGAGTSGTVNSAAGLGTKIGEARVYWFGVSDAPYTGNLTEWDLYLFDVQTYTTLYLARGYTTSEVPLTSFVRGLSSGATGYLSAKPNTEAFSLSQTSGTFIVGEQVIINERQELTVGIRAINSYTVEDIKSVYQNANALNTSLQTDFLADTVLYERTPPNFTITDQLTITSGGTATCPGRFFSGVTGIRTESIIKYQESGNTDPTFNRISTISSDGSNLTLSATGASITGVCDGTLPPSTVNSVFSIMEPRISNLESSGLYSALPKPVIASVNLSQSDLTITKQITGRSTNASGSLTITTSDALDSTSGITSVFFESFDSERYSIHYSNGTIEDLNSGQFQLGSEGNSAQFTGLLPNQTNVTVIVTLKKRQITNKTKDFVRSRQISVTRTSGVSTVTGLSTSQYYGTRVEDREICLNLPDVVSVRAIYESTNQSAPVLDTLTFATGLSLDTFAIIGEKIVGQDSRAVAQVVDKTASTIKFVNLNSNNFQIGEVVRFKESNITAVIQEITLGSYINRTSDYNLDKGHKEQYSDYSRIVRKPSSSIPSKQLLIIFDYYKVSEGNTGDLFTVNSYTEDRYSSDIPVLPNNLRATDILDFRPRVQEFDPSSNVSPFAFSSRLYETNYRYVVTPNETSFIGYSYYLPRVDLVTINRLAEVEVIQGEPSDTPTAPFLSDDAMELARLSYPAYLFNPQTDVNVVVRDNKRFTMRDIGRLEKRIQNLEEITSLSILELGAQTLQVTDANGLNRFKSGFVVSDFRDNSLADPRQSTVDISREQGCAICPVDFWSIPAELALDPGIDRSAADLTQNLRLLDSNIKKTGDILTLDYEEVLFLEQPHATNVENVNPFNVIAYVGGIILDPASDNWVRTIYIDDNRTESTGAQWVNDRRERVRNRRVPGSERVNQWGGVTFERETTVTVNYNQRLENEGREFNYVEDVRVSGEVDPYMRSRNVYFNANGLRPFTRHYLNLDSQQVDFIPKLCEIEMVSGTFQGFETVTVTYEGETIGNIMINVPNHKFGDPNRPDIGAGLGSPAVSVEVYSVDPYDRTRPAPTNTYSATSRLINFGTRVLATEEQWWGYVREGATVTGQTSGAVARITRAELISDNWGDIVANFFIRDPNTNPPPQNRVTSGTKTIKVTAVPPGVTPLPGSTAFASESVGTYSASGTVLTQYTSRVAVRNPPRPAARPTEVLRFTQAVHRDPLAQSFRVEGAGIFLSSFDLYFAAKDPSARVFVELRTVELGTPTSLLVQDYAQVALNPSDININEENPFEPVPTRIRFPSPVFLEAGEYAIVILSPASDAYEMWTATMGQRTVRTQNLPDVQNVVVTRQYIGGSLFKSQNGTIWTASQYQDLTFKLYKAQFVPSGRVTFYNTNITPNGTNVQTLINNPIEGLPRKLKLPVSGVTGSEIANIRPGVKIGQGSSPSITGIVENLGGPIGIVTVVSVGTGYSTGTYTGIPLYSISGKGSGAQATITFANGRISSYAITNSGTGYVIGEVLGITTSSVGSGFGGRFGVQTRSTFDNIYLTNVQGENFTNTSTIVYYTNPNNESTRTNTAATVNGTSTLVDNKYSGNVFKITQTNHAHHGANNKIEITNVRPDREQIALTANFGANDTIVSVANTTVFSTFEGITTSRGYALVGNEVVSYSNITQVSGNAGTLSIDGRGLNGTIQVAHTSDEFIKPYEVNGVSLMRINKVHDTPSTYYRTENSNLDNYFLEFDRSTPTNRSGGNSMLNFATATSFGGNSVRISQNHQFSSIQPMFNIITPGNGTVANAQIRTVSGTSAGGSEVSFIDQGYEAVPLNTVTHYPTPRLVASRINETTRLTSLPSNKSLALAVDFSTGNPDLSPVMDIQNATFVLGRNRTNNPIPDYVLDSRSNNIEGDPHGAIFATTMVTISQPATSLKVIVAANRQPGSDIRAFYRLLRVDSTEVDQSYTAFPGYDNLIDTDGDGFGDRVIDLSLNTGRPDAFVTPDIPNSFSEYQFTANNLAQFNGFAIKIVMSSLNESTPVKLRDFRCIALA